MSLPVVGKAHEAKAADRPFHWFIYGSSLDRAAFEAWARQHGYRVPDFSAAVPARLDGYRLAFDVASNYWGGAVASLTEDPDGVVEGISLPMPAEALGLVDHKEGAISGLYRSFEVTVAPIGGGASITALAYRASPDRRLPAEGAPSARFIEVLIQGARRWQLSADHIARLEALRG